MEGEGERGSVKAGRSPLSRPTTAGEKKKQEEEEREGSSRDELKRTELRPVQKGLKVRNVRKIEGLDPISTCLVIPGVQGIVPGARAPRCPTQECAFQQFSDDFWGDSIGKTASFYG